LSVYSKGGVLTEATGAGGPALLEGASGSASTALAGGAGGATQARRALAPGSARLVGGASKRRYGRAASQ
jgi:hypothetical protein